MVQTCNVRFMPVQVDNSGYVEVRRIRFEGFNLPRTPCTQNEKTENRKKQKDDSKQLSP
jgi:hypothetical protein